MNTIPADHRSGYVALIGKPNVGKSTLLNAMLGRKLSIVTNKPQTTRHRVLGILSEEKHQIIFLDTPGIIKPRYKMQESMMHDVHDAIADADLLVFMADATKETIDTFSLARIGNRPAILVINKMDRIAKVQAIPLITAYDEAYEFEEILPISALHGDGLDVLLAEILKRLPLDPPFYPQDMVSEHPERFFVSEIIREKIFELYKQEIPYSTQVNIVQYEERKKERDYIHAEIVVERDSQKGILIGKGGQALKQVGTAARKDIEEFLGKRIYLELFVKVRDDWRNKDTLLKSYGYRT